MIYNQKVLVIISNNNKYYCSLGYGDHKQKSTIVVDVFDLPKKSIRKIKAKCDDCGKDWMACYANLANKSHHRCFQCARNWVGKNCDQSKAITKNKERVGDKHPRWRSDKPEFKTYHRLVTRETNFHNLHELKNYGLRGLAGKPGAYHLDHKISIFYGYSNKISPVLVGSRENLCMIPWQENYKKREKSSITLGELLASIEISSMLHK